MTNQPFDVLFEQTVVERGPAYYEARDRLVTANGAVTADLKARSSSNDWRVALQSEILLGWIQNRPLVEQCLEICNGKLPGRPRNITGQFLLKDYIKALVQLGPQASPCLLEIVLKRRPLDPDVTARATGALNELGHPHLQQVLLLALADEDSALRTSAANLLSRFPAPEVTDALLAKLQDPSEEVQTRATIARALSGHPSPRTATQLRGIVADDAQPYEVRSGALDALVKLKDHSSGATIRAAAQRARDPQFLLECVAALGDLGDRGSLAFLQSLKNHSDSTVREEVRIAIDKLTSP